MMPSRVLLLTAVLLACPLPAAAQERVELTEQGWQITGSIDPDTAAGGLALARRAFAAGDFRDAERRTDAWLLAYPNSLLAPEAYLLRGDALAAKGDRWRALFDYEYVIRVYPGSEAYSRALEREYEIAYDYVHGEKRRLFGVPILGALGEGAELLIRIQERAPGTRLAERAMLELADHYYRQADMFLASEAYDLFLENYPASADRQYAMLRLVLSHLSRFKGPAYDMTGLIDAQQWLDRYRQEFPAAAEQVGARGLDHRIDESLARKQFETAGWFERRNETVSAAYTYAQLVRDFPATTAAVDALDRLDALGPVPGLEDILPNTPARETTP